MIMKSASEKGTFFYLSFKTENEFVAKNTSLIEIAQMLRKRPDKVNSVLICRLWRECMVFKLSLINEL
jgi:hypothetical protein